MDALTYFPHLEIQIVEHCNLNCASCTHFSPLANESFIEKEALVQQLKQANKIFNGHCKSLKIMGGEPLLHPQIDKLICLARKAMPNIPITIQTNGICLNSMPEVFWKACHENNILIRVTRYPVKLDLIAISTLAKKYNVDLKFHPSSEVVKSFNLYPIDIYGRGDKDKEFAECKMKCRYVLIKDGKLFTCPIVGNAEHFNHAFGTNLEYDENNYMDLNSVDSFEQFEQFAKHAIPFCKYCKPAEYRKDIGWAHSQKKITEWT